MTPKRKIALLFPFLVLTVFTMRYFDSFIKNDICTSGITSFELAKHLDKMTAIVHSWDTKALAAINMSMGFDFLFIFVYVSFIILILKWIIKGLNKASFNYKLGGIFIKLTLLAGLFDIVENIALIRILLGNLTQLNTSISYYFASAKFALLAFAILYILINVLWTVFKPKKS
jgi:hypothetical protein